MLNLIKNASGQEFNVQLVDRTDGTDVTTGTPTLQVKKDGGAYGAAAGTITHDANGSWAIAPTAADTDADDGSFKVTLTDALTVTLNFSTRVLAGQLTQQQIADAMRLLPTGTVNAGSVDEQLTDVRTKTDHGAWLVYFDSVNGAPGGAGTLDDPISDEATAITRMVELKTRLLVILDGTFTVPAAGNVDGFAITGTGLDTAVALNNRSADGAHFEALSVSGAQGGTGEIFAVNCLINAATEVNGLFFNCLLLGISTVGSRGTAYFAGCQAADNAAPPTVDFQNNNNANAAFVNYHGNVTMAGLGANDPLTHMHLNGVVEFDSTCTNNVAPVVLSGSGAVIDNSGAGFDIDTNQFLTIVAGNAEADVRAWEGIATVGMVEDVSGARYTTKALEQTPGAAGGTDWTAGERNEIRQALGVTGTKTATAGGNLDAVQAKTDQLAFSIANQVDANALTVGDTVTVATNNDKTGYGLTAAERDAIADAHLDRTSAIETGITPRGAHRIAVAGPAGKTSGAGTAAFAVRDVADTKDRITAVTDALGNRSSTAVDVS